MFAVDRGFLYQGRNLTSRSVTACEHIERIAASRTFAHDLEDIVNKTADPEPDTPAPQSQNSLLARIYDGNCSQDPSLPVPPVATYSDRDE